MGEYDVARHARRTTQRALYSSLLSIVACALMLFGTTFAWFSANAASGVSTLSARSFDVDISPMSVDTEGAHTVTLTRTGGGSAAGYCRFTLTMSGTYNETTTVTYQDGTEVMGEPVQKTLEQAQTCYANFSDGIDTITFTLNLTGNSTATITDAASSWGSYSGTGTGLRLLRAARPTTREITDGAAIDFGMEDQTPTVEATEEQEAAHRAELEAAAAATEEQAADPAAQAADPAAQTDNTGPAAQAADPAAQTDNTDPAAQAAEPTAQTADPAAQAQSTQPTEQEAPTQTDRNEDENDGEDNTDDNGAGDPDAGGSGAGGSGDGG